MLGGERSLKIFNKKAALIISQGDSFISSSMLYLMIEKNLNDFKRGEEGMY